MTRTLPALLALTLTACTAPLAPGAPNPAPSQSTAATAVASPAASTTLPTCSLPVGLPTGGSAFIHVPTGNLEPANGPLASIPEIGGYYTQTYDWAVGKWVPVMPKDLAPDGSKYAYQNNERILKVVDVTTGVVTPIPGSAGWNLIATANDGVYVHTYSGHAGLWFLRYAGGDPAQVSPAGYSYTALGGGYAYAVVGKDDSTLLQVDLRTSLATKFADPPATVLGFDNAGVPVVGLASSLVLMPAPYQQKIVVPGQRPPGAVVGDAHGLWIPLNEGIFLATPDGRVTQVTPMAGQIQGTCR